MNKIRNSYFKPWRYPSNWIFNIKEFFHSFKRFVSRGRYGISYYDVWNLNSYMLQVFENGFKTYKKDNIGYPIGLTEQEWDNILNRIEELIKIVQIDGIECEEAEKYWKKDDDRWIEEVKKWDKYKVECWEELCDIMKEWYFGLWW